MSNSTRSFDSDHEGANAGGAPRVSLKALQAPGILPKNLRTYATLAIGALMILTIFFSSGNGRPKTSQPTVAPVQLSPTGHEVEQFKAQLDAETRALAADRQRLAQAKHDADEAEKTLAGQGSLITGSVTRRTGVAGAQTPAAEPPLSPLVIDPTKREDKTLLASNIALSFREPISPRTRQDATNGISLATVPTQEEPVIGARDALAGPQLPIQQTTSARTNASSETKDRLSRAPDPRTNSELYRLFEGTILEGVLTNRIDGYFSGPVNVMITTGVYSHDHQEVLIPQGTRVLGEAQKVSSTGQQRLAVTFHRLIMPDGYSHSLDNFQALSQTGEAGLRDLVNHHYVQVFGTSLAIGAIAGIEQSGANYGAANGGVDAYERGTSQSLSQSALHILDRFLNVLPTFTVREGHRIKIILTGDVLLPRYQNHKLPSNF